MGGTFYECMHFTQTGYKQAGASTETAAFRYTNYENQLWIGYVLGVIADRSGDGLTSGGFDSSHDQEITLDANRCIGMLGGVHVPVL